MISSPPSYIALAVTSHEFIKDRASAAAGKPLSGRVQALLLASRIAVPKLPADWRVTDVELLGEANNAPALLIAIETAQGNMLSILAIRERSSAPSEPDTVRKGGQSVAYWQEGDFSYALTGEGDPQQLDATADALADSWRT
jgi:anti-sigma factor RsiW